MAREFAQIKLSIWGDDDFRARSVDAQHLYFTLLTSATLTHCGIADWRPARIAAMAEDWTPERVEVAGCELEDALYLVIDRDTEEALIRSYIRNDQLMKQPKMAVAIATAHAGTASRVLRGVVVHELTRLRKEFPDLSGWGSDKALELLDRPSVDPHTFPLRKGSGKGSRKGSGKGSEGVSPAGSEGSAEGSGNGSTFPVPIPAPTTGHLEPVVGRTSPDPAASDAAQPPAAQPTRGTRLPRDWTPPEESRQKMLARYPGRGAQWWLDETEKFCNHWWAKAGRDATKIEWPRAWENWIHNAKAPAGQGGPAAAPAPAGSKGWDRKVGA